MEWQSGNRDEARLVLAEGPRYDMCAGVHVGSVHNLAPQCAADVLSAGGHHLQLHAFVITVQ